MQDYHPLRKPKILILMSATGGGHKASAEAIQAGFETLYPNRFQIDIYDLLAGCLPRPLNYLPKTYPFLVNDAQWAWKMLWNTAHYPQKAHRIMALVSYFSARNVSKVFQHYNPDLIISVHYLTHEMSFYGLDRLQWQRPFFTVVTDLINIHPLWFHPAVTACYVPNALAQQQALCAGLAAGQVHQYGLPVRPAFAQITHAKRQLRLALGMQPDLPAVLVIGGGDGFGQVAEITRQLEQRLAAKTNHNQQPLGQIVVIAGHNQPLVEELKQSDWCVPVRVNGFVGNMAEWMSACDCVVSKAGPGAIAEATICGLPMILSSFIPGHEVGNIDYVVENGAGIYQPDPVEIGETVRQWFAQESDSLQSMAQCSRRLGRPQATFDIVRSINNLL